MGRVNRVVGLSSDKAFQPASPYGASKAFAESLFLAANNTRGHYGPRFAVIRYGNVWCSTGSVVPTWKKMLADGAMGAAAASGSLLNAAHVRCLPHGKTSKKMRMGPKPCSWRTRFAAADGSPWKADSA
jgi:Polysaccharide biosynthesis protein